MASQPHATPAYSAVLARNIRAARAAIDIGQESVAARMRALGYTAWVRQTVGSTERGRRRPTAEEIPALAYALQTSISALMAPPPEADLVRLPAGLTIDAGSLYRSVHGMYDHAIFWDGDEPVLHPAFAGSPDETRQPAWPPAGMSHGAYQRISDLQEQVAELRRQLAKRGGG